MANEIEKILENSEKADMLERFTEELVTADKVVVVIINELPCERFNNVVMTYGLASKYEAYGILDVVKQDMINEDLVIRED